MDPILPYFSAKHSAGRNHLATLAVVLALAAIPGFCLIIPGVILAVVAMVFGTIAIRQIDEKEERVAHGRAQAAVVIAFLEMIVGCSMAAAMLNRF
ncbi:MAG TPA: hypothetical protein VGN88_12560 [Phycisphaerae bacterium]